MDCVSALITSLLAHTPYFFQYNMCFLTYPEESQSVISLATMGMDNIIKDDIDGCWLRARDRVTDQIEWEIFNILTHTVLRIIPTLFIIALNLAMYQRIKEIMSNRRRLLRVKSAKKAKPKKSVTSMLSKTNLDMRRTKSHGTLETISGRLESPNNLQVPQQSPTLTTSGQEDSDQKTSTRRVSATTEALRRIVRKT